MGLGHRCTPPGSSISASSPVGKSSGLDVARCNRCDIRNSSPSASLLRLEAVARLTTARQGAGNNVASHDAGPQPCLANPASTTEQNFQLSIKSFGKPNVSLD